MRPNPTITLKLNYIPIILTTMMMSCGVDLENSQQDKTCDKTQDGITLANDCSEATSNTDPLNPESNEQGTEQDDESNKANQNQSNNPVSTAASSEVEKISDAVESPKETKALNKAQNLCKIGSKDVSCKEALKTNASASPPKIPTKLDVEVSFDLAQTKIAAPATAFQLVKISQPGAASHMMISTSKDFQGAAWTPIAETHQFSFEGKMASCGAHSLYLKFKNKAGLESASISKGVEITCTTSLATLNAPQGRINHSAIWTGTEMIIWGGSQNPSGRHADGAAYNPTTDTWRSIANAPEARDKHTTVWTGSKMIIFGGSSDACTAGGFYKLCSNILIYDPSNNTWETKAPANGPSARWGHSAVWTGTSMIVWGGWIGGNGYCGNVVNDGFSYDVSANSWTAISSTNSPSARDGHRAVWTGSKMEILGGSNCSDTSTRGVWGSYDPSSGTWTSRNIMGSNTIMKMAVIWKGNEALIWDGAPQGVAGHRWLYNPESSSIKTIDTLVGDRRNDSSLVWTGSEAIVWGGQINGQSGHTGTGYKIFTNWLGK